ncbi:hypothetical protein Amn_24180 [Aminobacter sp. Y103A]|uniref:hypothetical protein n=1 Tax=Aminobacter sp. Y103A TaxID=1870862 RepID=UPI0025733E1B|nr:hypothetical protein [Aminobacter sp. SS-2016]BBD37538.1 hypothetical protein Amn_24180 [Aminobacter sp. SS-2016]
MALLKKSVPATEPFRIPTLAEADADYAAMEAKLAELNAQLAATKAEDRSLERDILARPAPGIRSGVAELLGDAVDISLHGRPARLQDLRRKASDIEAAIEIIRRRMADRRSIASVAACKAVRDEYGRRVRAIITALEAVAAARADAEQILDGLEREDVQYGYLPPLRPTFLGTIGDGHIDRYIRSATEAGYV